SAGSATSVWLPDKYSTSLGTGRSSAPMWSIRSWTGSAIIRASMNTGSIQSIPSRRRPAAKYSKHHQAQAHQQIRGRFGCLRGNVKSPVHAIVDRDFLLVLIVRRQEQLAAPGVRCTALRPIPKREVIGQVRPLSIDLVRTAVNIGLADVRIRV